MNRQLFDAMVAQYKKQTVTSTNDILEWNGGAHCYLPSLKFYGACSQNGTPAPNNPVDIYEHKGIYQINPEGQYIYTPTLRGIGSYKDEWDFITGKGLRYIHKVELDGVSDYKKAIRISSEGRCDVIAQYTPNIIGHQKEVLSSHFIPRQSFEFGSVYLRVNPSTYAHDICFALDRSVMSNVSAVNAWLAEQHENGTPVIIYYVLAEPIPFEEKDEQSVLFPIPNDNGKIRLANGNISGVPFTATYITHS